MPRKARVPFKTCSVTCSAKLARITKHSRPSKARIDCTTAPQIPLPHPTPVDRAHGVSPSYPVQLDNSGSSLNDGMLKGLDYFLSEAGKRGLKVGEAARGGFDQLQPCAAQAVIVHCGKRVPGCRLTLLRCMDLSRQGPSCTGAWFSHASGGCQDPPTR